MIPRILLTLLLAASAAAQDPARLEELVQASASDGSFMGSVLVARGEEILLNKGYGSANLEWDIPNSPKTKFRLGSITKQFTAASILLLEERGKLSTDDPIKKFVPEAPAAWDAITVYHVLTHTAGIPSYTGFPTYRKDKFFPATPEELVARFRDEPLDFQPGESWKYSNSGYTLLGNVIEKASGQTYQAFLQENIFDPLGMQDSGYDSNSQIIPRRAAGYSPGPSGPVNAPFIDMTIPFSAGALYSTTEDLLRWQQGLYGGKLLSAASLEKMTTPFKNEYACGVTVRTVNERKVISHGGGIEGFSTFLAYYPGDKLTVVTLGNLQGSAPQQIAGRLGAAAHGDEVILPEERKEISVAPGVLQAYVGTYQLAPKVSMMIRLVGDHLTTQLTGQGQVPMFASSETEFFTKLVDAQIDFEKDGSGKVTRLCYIKTDATCPLRARVTRSPRRKRSRFRRRSSPAMSEPMSCGRASTS